jgi:hypothetical protein
VTERLTYKLSFIFLFAVLLILPFWPAAIELVTFRSGLTTSEIFYLKEWYEPLLLILFLFTVFNPSWEKHKLNLKPVDWLVLSYLLWSVASIFLSGESLSQGIQGIRYNGLFFLFYLLARYSFFSVERIKILQNLAVVLGKIVSVWAVVEVVLFKAGYWQNFGLLPLTSSFGYGSEHKVVDVPQAMATLEGPNQLGSYLLLPFFLLLAKGEKKAADWIWLLVMASGVVLSFSRSAIIGLVIGVIIYLIAEKKISLRTKGLILVASLAVVALAVAIFNASGGLVRDFFSHGSSSTQHLKSMIDTFRNNHTASEIIIGQGIGTAGPASFNFQPNIQESWYLQVLSELGIIGLAIWLGIIILLVKDLLCHPERSEGSQDSSALPQNDTKRGISLALVGVSLAALFLHTFADNPAVAISLFILIGIVSNTQKPINNHQ